MTKPHHKTEAELHALRDRAARRRDARDKTVIRKRPSVDVETYVRVKNARNEKAKTPRKPRKT